MYSYIILSTLYEIMIMIMIMIINDNLLDYGSRLQAGLVQHRYTYNKI